MNAVIDGTDAVPTRRWPVACALLLAVAVGIQLLWPHAPSITLALFAVAVAPATLSRAPANVFTVAGAAVALLVATAAWNAHAVAGLALTGQTVQALLALALVASVAAAAVWHLREAAHHDRAQADLVAARERLERSERLMGMAERVGRFGGWAVDLRAGRVIWTAGVAAIHELDPDHTPSVDEAIGYYAPEFRAQVTAAVQRCAREGKAFDEEWQLVTATGRRVWIRSTGEAVRDREGHIVELQGAFQDIDVRRRMEASLQISQQRVQRFADAMPLMVWTTDAGGRLDYLNRFGYGYVGAGTRLLGDAWLDVVHPTDRPTTVEVWAAAIRSGNPFVHEFRLRRHDGVYRWHLARAVAVREGGEAVSGWFGTCIDIDERLKLAARYERTLEAIADAFFSLDREWRFTYMNSQFERLSGATGEQLLGRSIWEVYPELLETPFHARYRQAMEEDRAMHFEERHPLSGRWFDVNLYPSDDGLAVYFRDITQEREVEQRLQFAQRMDSLGQLTGGVAHDFNNLLTVIVGNAGLLTESLTGDTRRQRMAQMIATAAQRGADLTQRLLAFARMQPLEPRPTDCVALVHGMQALLASALGETVQVELDFAPGLPAALVDPGQLENALLNLCLNARDAMPDGGRIRVTIERRELPEPEADDGAAPAAGEYLCLRVSDSGVGIAAEHLPHVFDPFYTTKAKEKGTGLGLAMVYGFARQSGGAVDLVSEPGVGTTVTLCLPRADSPAVDGVEPPPPVMRGNGETVLVVEDDELVRVYVAGQLEELGYTVLLGDGGAAALKVLEARGDVALLLTDVIMPGGMNGCELAEQARQLRPGLAVLFTSGYTEDELLQDGRLAAGVQLLRKPYLQETLARRVHEALRTRA